jgi:hypothetical protein
MIRRLAAIYTKSHLRVVCVENPLGSAVAGLVETRGLRHNPKIGRLFFLFAFQKDALFFAFQKELLTIAPSIRLF